MQRINVVIYCLLQLAQTRALFFETLALIRCASAHLIDQPTHLRHILTRSIQRCGCNTLWLHTLCLHSCWLHTLWHHTLRQHTLWK